MTLDIEFNKEHIIDNIVFSIIDKSMIHGYGLFATANIKKTTIMGVLDGQIIKWDQYDKIVNKLKESINNHLDYMFTEWNALDRDTLLVRQFRTKYSYINHSYQPNLEIRYNPIRVVCIKDININEEFTLDYSKEPLREEYLNGHGKTYL